MKKQHNEDKIDDKFCEEILQRYFDDESSDKHETVTLEELAEREGIAYVHRFDM